MNQNTLRHLLAFAGATLLSVPSFGQTLDESLTVEGKYKPVVIEADRISLFPEVLNLTAPESNLTYEQNGVSASFAPDGLPMPATGWRTNKKYSDTKGYLDLGIGSWLNSSLSAGYQAIRTEDTRLNVWLQHNSTSLWQAWKEGENPVVSDGAASARRFRYDETIGADLRQKIKEAGVLTADLQYHLGYFNYYSVGLGGVKDGRIEAPTQTINDISLHLGWQGNTQGKFSYRLYGDMRRFAYRTNYRTLSKSPIYSVDAAYGTTDMYEIYKFRGERQTNVNIGGDARFALGDNSAINVGLDYEGLLNRVYDNLHLVRLNPNYTLTRHNMSLRIGAHLAIAKTAEKDKDYYYDYLIESSKARFRAAPDILFTYRKGIVAIAAGVGGGTETRSLGRLHQMDYYARPYGSDIEAYTPIEGRLALQINPGGKWTFGIEGGWKNTLNEVVGGTYIAYLNDIYQSEQDLWRKRYYPISEIHLHGFTAGINAGYDFSKYFALQAKGTFQPQHGNVGVMNGYDRPRVTVEATALSHPTDALTLRLDYNLRACRELLPGNISLLNLGATYSITERFAVGAELNNLLNRHEMPLPYLPTEGFNASAGIQLLF